MSGEGHDETVRNAVAIHARAQPTDDRGHLFDVAESRLSDDLNDLSRDGSRSTYGSLEQPGSPWSPAPSPVVPDEDREIYIGHLQRKLPAKWRSQGWFCLPLLRQRADGFAQLIDASDTDKQEIIFATGLSGTDEALVAFLKQECRVTQAALDYAAEYEHRMAHARPSKGSIFQRSSSNSSEHSMAHLTRFKQAARALLNLPNDSGPSPTSATLEGSHPGSPSGTFLESGDPDLDAEESKVETISDVPIRMACDILEKIRLQPCGGDEIMLPLQTRHRKVGHQIFLGIRRFMVRGVDTHCLRVDDIYASRTALSRILIPNAALADEEIRKLFAKVLEPYQHSAKYFDVRLQKLAEALSQEGLTQWVPDREQARMFVSAAVPGTLQPKQRADFAAASCVFDNHSASIRARLAFFLALPNFDNEPSIDPPAGKAGKATRREQIQGTNFRYAESCASRTLNEIDTWDQERLTAASPAPSPSYNRVRFSPQSFYLSQVSSVIPRMNGSDNDAARDALRNSAAELWQPVRQGISGAPASLPRAMPKPRLGLLGGRRGST